MELTLRLRYGIGVCVYVLFSFAANAQNNCSGIQIRYAERYANSAARCGAPSMVTFRNTSGGSKRENTLYKWYINDSLIGQSTGRSNINFSYTDTGVYQLKIVATDTATLCSDSLEDEFLVYNRPTPTIVNSQDTVCAGTMVYFHPTVKDSWRYSSYYWRFPDNTTSTDTSVGFLMTNTGNQRIRLRVRNTSQCDRWVTKYIHVTNSTSTLRLNDLNGNPSANPIWENCILSAGAVDTFQLILSTPDSVFNYTIDFGDGNTLNGGTDTFLVGKVIYHTYQNLGTYQLTIVGEDANGCRREVRGTVVNERIPTAGIIGPPSGNQSGCAPLAVRFINNSYNISNSTTFTWTYGDGRDETFPSSNAGDTIWHTYLKDAADCDLEVTLTAQNACGNSVATWAYVNVFDEDDVSLSASSGYVCLPDSTVTLSVNIDRNCVGGQRFFFWDFGDGRNSGWTTTATPRTVTYNKAGTYSALIIDSNVCGLDSAIYTVTVRDPIQQGFQTAFNAVNTNNCAPVKVDFTDQSIGVFNYRLWTFGNGASSGASNPSYTYTTPGEYIFSLTQGNECERISVEDTIRVYGKPQASIATIDSTCYPATIRFQNQTPYYSPAASFLWTLPDNSTSTAVQPSDMVMNTPGDYSVRLIVTDSCGVDTTTMNFRILDFPKADFSVSGVCEGNSTPFTNLSTIGAKDGRLTNYLWRFGDGNTSTSDQPMHSYLGFGNFSVTLIATSSNGCADSVTKNVAVFQQPGLTLSKNAAAYCPGAPVNFRSVLSLGSSIVDSLIWDLGDGTILKDTLLVSHAFVQSGNYGVSFRVLTKNGCSNTGIIGAYINKNPVILAMSDSVCLGDSTLWIDKTDSLTARKWDLNLDGVTDETTDSFTHLFSSSGTNRVALEVQNMNGCSATDTIEAVVFSNPNASIGLTNDSICQSDSLTFQNLSSGADTFYWNFNDGQPVVKQLSTQSITYTMDSLGTQYVALTAVSRQGCQSIDKDTFWSILRPIAAFTFTDSQGCAPFNVQVSNTSSNASDYQWFVNGAAQSTTSQLANFDISQALDTAVVLLIAHNTLGCHSDTFTNDFSTYENPVAQFSKNKSKGCGPLGVKLTNLSKAAISYQWSVNSLLSTTKHLSPVFVASQSKDTLHFINLTALSTQGCRDSIQDSITVYPNPMAQFSQDMSKGCGPLAVNFSNASAPNDTGSINDMSFQWSFGNGTVSQQRDTAISFSPGKNQDSTYLVRLIAFSEHGCADTAQKQVVVYPIPFVDFATSTSQSCHPLTTRLTNQSSPKDTGTISIMSFQWVWANGNSTARNQNLQFNNTGTADSSYRIKLVGISEHGCKDSTSNTLVVYPNPTAQLALNDSVFCKKDIITIQNLSSLADISYFNFGDVKKERKVLGTASQTKRYQFAGSFDVALKVETKNGCEDYDTFQLRTLEWPDARFASPDVTGCAPMDFSFTNQSRNADSFLWLKNGAPLSKTKLLSNQTLNDPKDSFLIHLVASNKIGCHTDTAQRWYKTFRGPSVGFSPDTNEACGDARIKFSHKTDYFLRLYWEFGDGTTSTKLNPKNNFQSSTLKDTQFVVKLVALTPEFCADSITDTIVLHPIPKVAFTPDVSDGCGPLLVNFKNESHPKDTGSIDIMSFAWQFGNASHSTFIHPADNFQASKTQDTLYNVKLTGYSEHGCADSFKHTISVYPNPTAVFTPSATKGCHPLTVSFFNRSTPNDTGSIAIMKFKWGHNGGSTSTRHLIDSFFNTGSAPKVYTIDLKGTSEHGCKDSSTVSITVNPTPIAQVQVSKDSLCLRDSFTISNRSTAADSFAYHWGNSSVTNRTNQKDLKYAYNKAGNFRLRLEAYNQYNCFDSASLATTVLASPIAGISPSHLSGCAPQLFTLQNTSQHAKHYRWLANGQLVSDSFKVNKQQILLDKDTIRMQLIADNALFCYTDTASITVLTHPDPIADFNMDTSMGCGPLRISFNSTSLGASLETWHFENRFKSFGPKAKHRFDPSKTQDTTYITKLTATTLNGCKDSTVKTIRVFPKPKADFVSDIDEGCGPLSVNFTNLSYPNDTGSIRDMKFLWNFTSQTETTQNPSRSFMASQTKDSIHFVKLMAYSEHGCKDSMTHQVKVFPSPTLGISPSVKHGCGPLDVRFINWSTPNDLSTILDMQFEWDYGNGDTSAGRFGRSVFTAPQFQDTTYQVRIIGKTEHFCSDTAYVPITLHPNPIASFEPSILSGCSPLTVDFKNHSSPSDTGGLGNMRFIWDLDNGIKSRKEMPSYVYRNDGYRDSSYSIELIAITKWQCRDTIKKDILVHPLPRADFNTNELFACSPFELRTDNLSKWANRYEWSVGGNQHSTGENMSSWLKSTTKNDSMFGIKLRAITNNGCVDSAIRKVRIFRQVVAEFEGLHKGCTPYDAAFHDNSKNALIHIWQFGDGISSNHSNPVHRYINEGRYGVTLKVIDATGCSDSTEVPEAVFLNKTPDARITLDTLQNELPNAAFTMQPTVWVSDGTVDYLWKSNEQPNSTTPPQNTYIYSTKGHKQITLKASTQYCADSTETNVDVLLPIPTPGFESDIKDGCVALEVAFSDTSQWAEKVEWFFGDGRSSKERNPIHTYKLPGVYKVSQKVTNERGQNYTTVADYITVYGLPYVDFDPTPKQVFLPDADVTFNNLSFNAVSFEWFKNDSLFSVDSVPFYRFTQEGKYDIRLVGRSAEGCIDSITHYNLVDVRAQGDVFIPTAFTPDGDGSNDGFRPVGYGVESKGYNLKIFNRWGERVFESNDKDEEWNGSFEGIPCQQDVYVWVVRLEFASGEIRYERGNVTLIW